MLQRRRSSVSKPRDDALSFLRARRESVKHNLDEIIEQLLSVRATGDTNKQVGPYNSQKG